MELEPIDMKRKEAVILLVTVMIAAPWISFMGHHPWVSAQVQVDNFGNGTATATWNYDVPSDYTFVNTSLSPDGAVLTRAYNNLTIGSDALMGNTSTNVSTTSGPVALNRTGTSQIDIYGDMEKGMFGANSTFMDYNGDGVEDLVVGAPHTNLNGSETGAVYVFFGPINGSMNASDADVVIPGSIPGERFGSSLLAEDIDGDGTDELVIGAPGYNGAGAIYISEPSQTRTIWSDDLEAGAAGWEENTTDTSPVWELSNETNPITNPAGLTAHSGYSCWETNLTGTYPAGGNHFWLNTPTINILGLKHPELIFWSHLELGDNDVLEVRVSADGGKNYNYTIATFVQGIYPNSPGVTWQKHVINLEKFRYAANITISFHGYDVPGAGGPKNIAIDDVSIVDFNITRITGPSGGFGYSLASSDMDGDGVKELLVGAPGYCGMGGVFSMQYNELSLFDGFNGNLSMWNWVNEPRDLGGGDNGGWNISGGYLNTATNRNTDFFYLDNGHLLGRNITGDFEMVTRIYANPSVAYQKSGLMIRSGCGDYVTFDLEYTDVGTSLFVNQKRNGTPSDDGGIAFTGSAVYLKAVRTGQRISLYYSEDGAGWTSRGTYYFPFNRTVMAGLFTASGGSDTNYRSSFDFLSMTGTGNGTGLALVQSGIQGCGDIIGVGDTDGDLRPDLISAGNGSKIAITLGRWGSTTTIYNMSSAGSSAYSSSNAGSQPPETMPIQNEAPISPTTNLLSSDDLYVSTNSANYKAHRFEFTINNPNNATSLWFRWEGHATGIGAVPIIIYAWDFHSAKWIYLNETGSIGKDVTLQGNISFQAQRFISSGVVELAAVANGSSGQPKGLLTDYVELRVTYGRISIMDLGIRPTSMAVANISGDGCDDLSVGYSSEGLTEIYEGGPHGINTESGGFHCSMPISVKNNNATAWLNTSYTVNITLDTTSWLDDGLILANGSDIRLTYFDAENYTWQSVPVHVRWAGSNHTGIFFKPIRAIPPMSSDNTYYLIFNASANRLPEKTIWSDSMNNHGQSPVYLAADDFEEHGTGDTPDGWTGDTGSFSTADDGGNMVLSTSSSQKYIYAPSHYFSNYTTYLDFRVAGGSPSYFGPRIRYNDPSNYVAYGVGTSSTELYFGRRISNNWVELGTYTVNDIGSITHTLEIQAYGEHFDMYMDGRFIASENLNAGELPAGYVGILSYYSGSGTVYYDNITLMYLSLPEPTVSNSSYSIAMYTLYDKGSGLGAFQQANDTGLYVSAVGWTAGKVYDMSGLVLNTTWIDVSSQWNVSGTSSGFGSRFSAYVNESLVDTLAVSSPLDSTYTSLAGLVSMYSPLYPASGSCTSTVIDMGNTMVIQSITPEILVPNGSRLSVLARSGNTTPPDGSWTQWYNLTAENITHISPTRYLQFMFIFNSTNGLTSPRLYGMDIVGFTCTKHGTVTTMTFTPAKLDRWRTFSWNGSIPPNCGISWNYSTDGGIWYATTGDLSPADTSSGSIQLRATMWGTGLSTPILGRLILLYDTDPVSGPPVISFISPVADTYRTGIIAVQCSASMDVTSVDFSYYVDVNGDGSANDGNNWVTIGSDTTPHSFTTSLDSSPISSSSVLIRAVAHDCEGLTGQTTRRIYVDNEAPTVAFISPLPGETLSGTVDLTLSYSSDVQTLIVNTSDLVIADLDPADNTVNLDTTALADGPVTIVATVKDRVGHEGSASVTVNIDNNAPVLEITNPADNTLVTGTVTLSYSASEPVYSGKWEYRTDSVWHQVLDAEDSSGIQWNTSMLNGPVDLRFSAYDIAGHWSEATVSVTADNIAPMPSFIYPSAGDVINGIVPVSVNLTEEPSEVSLSWHLLNGNASGSIPLNITGDKANAQWNTSLIKNESVVLSVHMKDLVGLEGSVNITVFVDNIAPTISILSPTPGSILTGTVALVYYRSWDFDVVSAWYAQSESGNFTDLYWHEINTSTRSTGTILWDTSSLDMTDVVIRLNITDRGGLSNASFFWPYTIDNTPPQVSFVNIDSGDHLTGNVSIEFNYSMETQELILSYYVDSNDDFQPNDGGSWITIIDSEPSVSYLWDTEGMDYSNILLRVQAIDGAGLVGQTILHGIEVDNTPPVVVFMYPSDGMGIKSVAEVRYDASPDTVRAVLEYSTDGENWTQCAQDIPADGIIEWNNSALGSVKVDLRIIVYDEVGLEGMDMVEHILLGKSPPQITKRIPDITMAEDAPPFELSLLEYATDTDSIVSELKWYMLGIDTTIFTTAGDGTTSIFILPMKNAFGNTHVTIKVVDKDGLYDSQDLWVNITPVNDPPIFDRCPDLIVHYDYDYIFNYTAYVSDVDNPIEDLFIKTSDPDNIRTHGLECIFNYSKEYLNQTFYVTLTVSDGQAYSSNIISVTVSTDWVPEVRKKLPDVVLNEGEHRDNVFDLDDYFYDRDKDSLYYSYGNTHVSIVIHDNHSVSMTADSNWYGVEHVTFRATDPTGALVEDIISITVINVNDPPVLDALPDINIHYDEDYRFDMLPYISDPDNQTSQLHIWSSMPAYVYPDYMTHTTLVYHYPEAMKGKYTVRIYLSDGIDTVNRTMNVTVSDNWPPELDVPLPNPIVFAEDTVYKNAFNISNYFSDRDGNVLYYSYGHTNINITIADDGWVTFSAKKDWNGEETATFRAVDPDGGMSETTIDIIVQPINDPPRILPIEAQNATSGQEFSIDLSRFIYDVDDDISTLTIEVQSEYNSTSVDLGGGILILRYNITEGIDHLNIVVTDPHGAHSNRTVLVRVTPAHYSTPVTSPAGSIWGILWILILVLIIASGIILYATYGRFWGPFSIREVYLVHEDTGIMLAHESWVDGVRRDEDLVSGMFNAISQFIEDAFKEGQGGLRSLEVGDIKVMIEREDGAYLAVIYEGHPTNEMKGIVSNLMSEIMENYGAKINGFKGSKSGLEGIGHLIRGKLDPYGIKSGELAPEVEESDGNDEK